MTQAFRSTGVFFMIAKDGQDMGKCVSKLANSRHYSLTHKKTSEGKYGLKKRGNTREDRFGQYLYLITDFDV